MRKTFPSLGCANVAGCRRTESLRPREPSTEVERSAILTPADPHSRCCSDLLPTITTPIQIVAGRDDDLVPWSNNQYLADLLPYSEIHPLDAGPFAWEQAAEEYGRLVVHWVSGGYRRVAAG
jgi:pimeloyl-ACP methyl ester carboxylesterase